LENCQPVGKPGVVERTCESKRLVSKLEEGNHNCGVASRFSALRFAPQGTETDE
jgi:hypothetical protein